MTESAWPPPPRDPGPWTGGPPVGPSGIPGPVRGASPTPPGAIPPPPAAPTPVPSSPATPAYPSAAYPPSYAPGPPPPPGAPRRARQDRAPAILRVVAALVVLGAIAGAAYVVLRGDNRYPKDWDPRVADIVAFVASARGHEFSHPVKVNFLSAAEYTKASTGGDDTGGSDAGSEDSTAEFRAIGLLTGNLDLTKATKELTDSGSLAFYSPDTKEVYVRGTDLTPGVRVTLAHELTHVLQDQVFDLNKLADRADTFRPLAEGDATRIEDEYVEKKLTDAERKAYNEESQAGSDKASSALEGKVPEILQAMFQAPYIFGPQVVNLAAAEGGNASVDKLFENPPSERAVFDPVNVDPTTNPFSDDQELTVAVPDGTKSMNESTFEPYLWYLMLSTRVDPHTALTAADGVVAAGYHSYKQGDRVCAAIQATSADAASASTLTSALRDWASASAGHDAEVEAKGDTGVLLTTCDPGASAEAGNLEANVLVLPAVRAQLFTEAIQAKWPADSARCIANKLTAASSVDELIGDNFPQAKFDAARDACPR